MGELSSVFEVLKGDDNVGIPKDLFFRHMQWRMKVTRETPLTNVLNIRESKLIRRLEKHEVVEVIQGPLLEGNFKGVQRIKAKAIKDGVEGWCTVTGNHGTQFLLECENTYKVVKETILTANFELGYHMKKEVPDRKLKLGETLDVLEWPRQEDSSQLFRVKGKVRGTDAEGWVTIANNSGVVYVVPI